MEENAVWARMSVGSCTVVALLAGSGPIQSKINLSDSRIYLNNLKLLMNIPPTSPILGCFESEIGCDHKEHFAENQFH
jgi:hypothetical protein